MEGEVTIIGNTILGDGYEIIIGHDGNPILDEAEPLADDELIDALDNMDLVLITNAPSAQAWILRQLIEL